MRTILKPLAGLLLTWHVSLAGAEAALPETSSPPEMPSATREWLEMQRSGDFASRQPQPLSGKAMDRIHERYLKSFTQPIPQYFEHAQPTTR